MIKNNLKIKVKKALVKSKKRNLKNNVLLQIYLNKSLLNFLDTLAKKYKTNRSETIRTILNELKENYK